MAETAEPLEKEKRGTEFSVTLFSFLVSLYQTWEKVGCEGLNLSPSHCT